MFNHHAILIQYWFICQN